jgi:hypothetical protein
MRRIAHLLLSHRLVSFLPITSPTLPPLAKCRIHSLFLPAIWTNGSFLWRTSRAKKVIYFLGSIEKGLFSNDQWIYRDPHVRWSDSSAESFAECQENRNTSVSRIHHAPSFFGSVAHLSRRTSRLVTILAL